MKSEQEIAVDNLVEETGKVTVTGLLKEAIEAERLHRHHGGGRGRGWLVVSGDPLKGLLFYGLFPSNEAACDWAQTALTGGEDWWVAPLGGRGEQ